MLPAPEVTIHVRPFQGCLHSRADTKIPLAPLRAAARQGEDRHTDTPVPPPRHLLAAICLSPPRAIAPSKSQSNLAEP